ncbi:MAG: hypothetical protein AAF497_14010 [Planctomycetota bacterium]
MKLRIQVLLLAMAAIAITFACLSPALRWINARTARMNEIQYELDYVSIRTAARELLASEKTGKRLLGEGIPKSIATTSPASVTVTEAKVRIEYGDGYGHFGLEITPKGSMPSQGIPIIDGVNYYQE